MYKNGLTGTDQSTNSAWPSAATYDSYGGSTDMMGATLIPSEVNASTFGVAISVRKSAGSGTMTAYIDHVRITLYTTDVLPVDLLSFDAHKVGNAVQLRWAKAYEVNNDHFSIEKSSDGINFSEIAKVNGQGNKASVTQYSFEDESEMSDVNYYRLTQVDFDGQTTVHPMMAVENTMTFASMENLVYPNPCEGIIHLDANKIQSLRIKSIELFDMAGNKIQSLETSTLANININASPGTYLLLISTNESSFSTRFVVR
ncbi:MAG: T9SS type A sorting domain-containing protein [Flavobacteriales bacterium]